MKNVKLGSGLVTIGNGHNDDRSDNPDPFAYCGVFGNCSSLETVEFGQNLVTIGHRAFSECIALKSLTLPDSVQTIGINAFYHNTALATVSFGPRLSTISACAFRNCPELQSVVFRKCDTPLLFIGEYAFASAVKLTAISFSESLKAIATGAFYNCTALEDLTLPNSLTTLSGGGYGHYGAFSGCTALKSVKLGSGLVTIGNGHNDDRSDNPDPFAYCGVFGNCSSLETVEFGQNLVTIGHRAFSECIALKSVTLPDTVQTIGVNAFYDNIRLTSVEFGIGIRSIGKYAFGGCIRLKSASFPDMPPDGMANAGFAKDVKLQYSSEYADEWAVVIESCGFTNAVSYDPSAGGGGSDDNPDGETAIDPRYALTPAQTDRAIASVTVNADKALDAFVLVDGKVYDSVLYIKNTADADVVLTLPSGFAYRALKDTTPLTVPAGTENILTITRIDDKVFLVSREELAAIQ